MHTQTKRNGMSKTEKFVGRVIGWMPKVIKNSFYKILINKQISEFESHNEKFINK